MSDNKFEPKSTIYGFEIYDYHLADYPIPFQDAQLIFLGNQVSIKTKEPKTKKEFEKIYNDYLEEKKKDEEDTRMLRKIAFELSKELDD